MKKSSDHFWKTQNFIFREKNTKLDFPKKQQHFSEKNKNFEKIRFFSTRRDSHDAPLSITEQQNAPQSIVNPTYNRCLWILLLSNAQWSFSVMKEKKKSTIFWMIFEKSSSKNQNLIFREKHIFQKKSKFLRKSIRGIRVKKAPLYSDPGVKGGLS